MQHDWSVDVTLEHEWPQKGGLAMDTIRIQQGILALDASEALARVITAFCTRSHINADDTIRVMAIDIKLMEDR